MTDLITRIKQRLFLPAEAKCAIRRDRVPVASRPDPGIDAVIEAGLRWLGIAHDRSPSQDGGVARHFGVVKGCWLVAFQMPDGSFQGG